MKEVLLRVPCCSATPEMPLSLETDLSIILVTAADTSQTYRKRFSNFRARKIPKYH